MTDEEIANLSLDVDDLVWLLSKQYGITPFILSSVMLARLSVMNVQLGSGDDWNRLLIECINKIKEETAEDNIIH